MSYLSEVCLIFVSIKPCTLKLNFLVVPTLQERRRENTSMQPAGVVGPVAPRISNFGTRRRSAVGFTLSYFTFAAGDGWRGLLSHSYAMLETTRETVQTCFTADISDCI